MTLNPSYRCFSPPDRKGLLDFLLESDPAQYPARAARQWIPPERLVSRSRRVSRQSCSPVDPAEYPTRLARQISPERLASGSRRVSHQISPPVDPAEYLARAARQWIPPSIPPDPAEYPTRLARQWIPRPAEDSLPVDPAEYPASIEPERLARRQWIPPC